MAEYIEKQVAIDALHEAYEARNPTQNAIMDKATMVIFRLPPVDVRPAAEILNAVDEAIIFLNNASNQMPYHVYSALYDLIYEICPNCGADMRGGDNDGRIHY